MVVGQVLSFSLLLRRYRRAAGLTQEALAALRSGGAWRAGMKLPT
jgi:hypothetical protein